jgi:hypothetical protein
VPSDPLLRVLQLLLPDDHDTMLLRACLLSGDPGVNAWIAWRAEVESLETAFAHHHNARRRLMPLLHHALRRNGIRPHPKDLAHLRAAYVHESRRSELCTRVLLDALSVLAGVVRVIVLKGAALAHSVYDEPALRHCHDIDLLVPPKEMKEAEARLTAAGFRRSSTTASDDEIRLIHSSGLPVAIHRRLFAHAGYCLVPEAVWAETATVAIRGTVVSVLSPSDALMHVCAHASYSRSRASLVWVCDAFLTVAHSRELDSQTLLQNVMRRNLTLPMAIMLGYLANELDVQVERITLETIAAASRRATAASREAALAGLIASRSQRLKELFWRVRGWDARWLVVNAQVLTSLRAACGLRGRKDRQAVP